MTPIFSRIESLYTEKNELQYAVPGGLIGVGTIIDPTLCRADRLVGQVLGSVGGLPEIYLTIEISFFLLRRLLGVKTEAGEKAKKVAKLQKGEVRSLHYLTFFTTGRDLPNWCSYPFKTVTYGSIMFMNVTSRLTALIISLVWSIPVRPLAH